MRQIASVVCSTDAVCMIPALLTRMSSPPNLAMTSPTSVSVSATFEQSARNASATPPSPRISETITSDRAMLFDETIATLAPSLA